MCSLKINNLSQIKYDKKVQQKNNQIAFRATEKPKELGQSMLENYLIFFKNQNVILDFVALHNMNLKNLRLINENVVSGATLERRSDLDLNKIKKIGIRKIIDLRSEATTAYAEKCRNLGFYYYNSPFDDVCKLKSPKYFAREKNKPMKIKDNFIDELKRLFEIINSGDVYLGCEYGIDRTNMALVLNYLFNRGDSKLGNTNNPPLLLKWPGEKRKEVFNRNVKTAKKIYKALSESQKKALNLESTYEACLKDRIAKLFKHNNRTLVGRYF